jgi:cobyrinic acid a,c-diamide synthase
VAVNSPAIAPPGLIIAAPSSGSGKTVLTLGILRALKNRGIAVSSAKVGPDYIDPAFHTAASGRQCLNLDPWAMRDVVRQEILGRVSAESHMVICEGVMGLFDGATATTGSTADVSAWSGWPVVLVVDVRAQAASAAAIVRGFENHRPDVRLAGVVFNKVGSERHAEILRDAMGATLPHIPILGYVPRSDDLVLPSRHLGLVQASEHGELEQFLEHAANHVSTHVDLDQFQIVASPSSVPAPIHASVESTPALNPLGQRIAVASDKAFAFCYDHVLQGWRDAGAELALFSPLANEGPSNDVDAVYLPGGYPELHGAQLASADVFLGSMAGAVSRGAAIYGECGGYMVLGKSIVDADGKGHVMTGLLPLETTFAERSLHLGYRRVTTCSHGPLGPEGTGFTGHEFHYARAISEDPDRALFQAMDSSDTDLGTMGMSIGNVAGSFFHLIDQDG